MENKKIKEKITNLTNFSKIEIIEEEEKIPLNEKFIIEQEKWLDTIKKHAKRLGQLKDINDLLMEIYVDRQILVDNKAKANYTKNQYEKILKTRKKDAYIKIKTQENIIIKYQQETTIFLDAEMAKVEEHYDFLLSYLEFLDNTIKTIDSLIFAIRNKINLEQLNQN